VTASRFQIARWVTCDAADGGERELQRFIDANAHRVAHDAVGAPTLGLFGPSSDQRYRPWGPRAA